MRWADGADGYGRISTVLHWLVASTIIVLIALGLLMEWTIQFDDQSLYAQLKQLHVATGAVLVVALIPRAGWRLISGWRPIDQPRPQRWLAVAVQGLLLALITFQAVTGVVSRWTARNHPGDDAQSIPFFGLFEIPSPWTTANAGWNRVAEQCHDLAAEVILALVAIHAAGALRHWIGYLRVGRALRSRR